MTHSALLLVTGLLFIPALVISLLVHEFGHYWAALRLRVPVSTVYIGIGPSLFGWTDRRNVRWQVAALPICGYVALLIDKSARPNRWALARVIAVFAAGPAINLVFATAIFFLVFATEGQRFNPPEITSVAPGYPADLAGMRPGDRVISIDGVPVHSLEDISAVSLAQPRGPLPVLVENAGQRRTLILTPWFVTRPPRLGPAGVAVRIGAFRIGPPEYLKLSPVEALQHAGYQTWHICIQPFLDAESELSNRPPREIIARSVPDVPYPRSQPLPLPMPGPADMLFILAIISSTLGVINLYPLPLLDGGNILYYGIAMLLGRLPGRVFRRSVFWPLTWFVLMLLVLNTCDHMHRVGALR